VKRRGLLALLLAGGLTAPLPVEAPRTSGTPKIGVLFAASQASVAVNLEASRLGLRELGHVEGQTFVVEVRYGDARPDRLPDLARDLVLPSMYPSRAFVDTGGLMSYGSSNVDLARRAATYVD
jgi:hypothetical protein